MGRTLRKYLLLVLLLGLGVGYFTRTRLGTVDQLQPETFAEPVQTPLTNAVPIQFDRTDYHYDVTPLFDYEISGLVVHKMNYSWFTIDRSETIFPTDLCLIWGDNLKNQVHREATVRFSQDCRFCNVEWRGNVPFNLQQLSNNHLLLNRPDLEKRLAAVLTGDQITLRGKLVNVKATLTGKAGRHDSAAVTWNTSTTRADTGAGACEVIYVEDVIIRQPANVPARYLFRVSLWGLGLVGLWAVVDLFR